MFAEEGSSESSAKGWCILQAFLVNWITGSNIYASTPPNTIVTNFKKFKNTVHTVISLS